MSGEAEVGTVGVEVVVEVTVVEGWSKETGKRKEDGGAGTGEVLRGAHAGFHQPSGDWGGVSGVGEHDKVGRAQFDGAGNGGAGEENFEEGAGKDSAFGQEGEEEGGSLIFVKNVIGLDGNLFVEAAADGEFEFAEGHEEDRFDTVAVQGVWAISTEEIEGKAHGVKDGKEGGAAG
jgi:hypothetical protein